MTEQQDALPYREADELWPDAWLRVAGFDAAGALMVRRMTETEIAETKKATPRVE